MPHPRLSARKLILSILIPMLAFFSLASWSLSSPVGATPDDNFHLAAIWCGLGDRPGLCENRGDDAVKRYIPTSITTATCYAFQSTESAACWDDTVSGMTEVERANVDRLYPPLFYGTMSVFASENVAASVIAMRLFNSAFAIGLLTAAFFALPRGLRPALVVSVAASAVPLGLFIYGSTNPSSWALLSAATVWISLYGAFLTEGRHRTVLLGLAVFGAVIGGGARADSAVFAVFGVLLALLLGARAKRSHLVPAIGASVIVAVSVAFYLTAWQGSSIVGGLANEAPPLTPGEHLSNLLSAPSLWTGALGGWGLGWLDTPMPTAVTALAVAVFWGAFFVGLNQVTIRRTIAVALAIVAMWLVPVFLLGQSRTLVGELVQPRYLLPLMLIAVAVASARFDASTAWRGMRAALAGTALATANLIALHFNIQRYTTGIDKHSIDPGADAEWWWSWAPPPLVVWVVGSLAFAGLCAALWLALSDDRRGEFTHDVGAPESDAAGPRPVVPDGAANSAAVSRSGTETAAT